jgi:farnesyl-diphosphate farnesyltransferase
MSLKAQGVMADLQDLLLKTSRTFALAIPTLPEPLRVKVTTAYLLFRIADTFEDAALWPLRQRLNALDDFARLLQERGDGRKLADRWSAEPPIAHAGYLELLAGAPTVFEVYRSLPRAAQQSLCEHLVRTTRGMAEFVERSDAAGTLRLADLDDLRRYCYVVAGIVGEMLTELFLLEYPALEAVADYVRPRSAAFGEGLQLVNILKDSSSDLTEGRSYLPAGVDRAAVFALARRDLERASEYVAALQQAGAPKGCVAFTALPVLLADASLNRVERLGPGAKLTRAEVLALVAQLEDALASGQPALPFESCRRAAAELPGSGSARP